jgi:ERCC4-type nuclease
MIIIDFREKDIIKHFTEMNDQINKIDKNVKIEIKTENLLLGDILIDKLLIERKTINDLAASIVDGRYKEQSFRLLKALDEGFKVFYFIEGNMDLYTGAITKNTLVSTIYSLTHKGFQVLLTKNSKETAFFILKFAEKMKKDAEKMKKDAEKMKKDAEKMKKDAEKMKDTESKDTESKDTESKDTESKDAESKDAESKDAASKDTESNLEVSYENTQGVIKTKKNKNITKDNISVFMLCQIPGISTTTAGILLKKYGHIKALIHAMKENPKEIEEFRHNDKKLNKNIIQNLNEYL